MKPCLKTDKRTREKATNDDVSQKGAQENLEKGGIVGRVDGWTSRGPSFELSSDDKGDLVCRTSLLVADYMIREHKGGEKTKQDQSNCSYSAREKMRFIKNLLFWCLLEKEGRRGFSMGNYRQIEKNHRFPFFQGRDRSMIRIRKTKLTKLVSRKEGDLEAQVTRCGKFSDMPEDLC